MVDRSYTIRVGADVGGVVSGMRTASASVRSFATDVDRGVGRGASTAVATTSSRFRNLGTTVASSMRTARASVSKFGRDSVSFLRNNEKAARNAGQAMLAIGTITLGSLALATREAIKWESAWAGVVKVLDGSPEQMAAVQGELRDLASTLPFAHEEIANVAAAAGQLGVGIEDVSEFTKVMLDLGVATNLTAEEAAFALSRMANIMGTAVSDVDRMGSAIVDLGNNSATTEAEIVEMALRISGAGETIGLTEADVLGFSAALSSVGIRAEAGGSAISRVMSDIASAVAGGGEELEAFADIAGVSSQEFAQAFNQAPAQAIDTFVRGLGRINEAGGNVFQTLEEVGFSDLRVRDALLRMANSGDLLSDSLELSAEAWEENNALVAEAEKRYESTESQLQIAKNAVADAAITFGELFLPAVRQAAQAVQSFANFMGDLPEPVQQVITALAGVAGVTALAGGAFLVLGPKVLDAVSGFRRLSKEVPAAGKALRLLGRGTAIAAGLFLVAEAAGAIREAISPSVTADVSEWTEVLLDASTGARSLGEELNRLFDINETPFSGESIDDFGDAMERITDPTLLNRMNDIGESIVNFGKGSHELQEVEAQFENLDEAMANLVREGRIAEAESAFGRMAREAEREGRSIEDLNGLLPEYNKALDGTKNSAEAAAKAGEENAASLDLQAASAGVATEEFEAAQEAVTDMVESWAESLASAVDPLGAWEAATKRAAESAAEAAGEGKEAWQDFAEEANVSLQEFIEELENQVEAQQNWATNIALLAGQVTDDVLNEIISWGPEAAPLVAEMVAGTEAEMEKLNPLIQASLAGNQETIADEIRKWAQVSEQVANELGQDTADGIAEGIATGQTTVEQALGELNVAISEDIPGEVTIDFDANTDQFREEAGYTKQEMLVLDALNALPGINLDDEPFNAKRKQALEEMGFLSQQTTEPTVHLNTEPFETRWGEAVLDLLGLDEEEAIPSSDLDIAAFESAIERAEHELSLFDEDEADPEARLEHEKYDREVKNARDLLESIKNRNVTVRANAEGGAEISGLRREIEEIRSRTVTITVNTVGGYRPGPVEYGRAYGGWIPGYAYGGGVKGRSRYAIDFRRGGHNPFGTGPRSDDVLARVSRGEFVVQASEAQKHRRLLEAINRGQIRGYQGGGAVEGSAMQPGAIPPEFDIRVYIGDRDLTDIVDVRINDRFREARRGAKTGTGANR